MKQGTTPRRALSAALALMLLGGLLMPHAAFADGDKGKDGKKTVVIIGPITKTDDPPKKK